MQIKLFNEDGSEIGASPKKLIAEDGPNRIEVDASNKIVNFFENNVSTGIVGRGADYITIYNGVANKELKLNDDGTLTYGGLKVLTEEPA